MRFYTLALNGACLPAVSADGGKTAFPFAALGLTEPDLAAFVRNGGIDRTALLAAAVKNADPAAAVALDTVRLCAPLPVPDRDVICLGFNYASHAAEIGRPVSPERPWAIYFSKRVDRATGTGDPIPSHPGLVESLDYEVELGVVIGRDMKGAPAETAERSVFGYTVLNDVSARDVQSRHRQWYLGKSLDGFLPMGPCIVTPDEIGDPHALEISCSVNGEERQHSNTRLMIHPVADVLAELSAGMTLRAGTVIATGTPGGVGLGFDPPRFLHPGDTVICRIEGIGALENTVE